MKRPFDMTDAEREALPVGPITSVFEPHTAEDYARGATGRGRMRPVRRGTVVTYYNPDDPIAWTDKVGHSWTFGQYADDKTWFKQALAL